MATNYDINYDDSRFQEVETDKKAAINELDKTYGEMIGQSDSYYQAQIDAAKDWEKKQTELQNQQTDFAIQEIEQQKAQAKKDYTKEQSGAYVDWQKQSAEYGANAEAMADKGMQNTGYSESSQVSMYNTYQNRITAARESYNLAVQNYNNSITEARLQNNSALAEIAYNALQQQLELSLQGFQYKNTLLLDKMGKKTDLENEYYARYQDVLAQINTENSLAEQIRQYNEQLALEQQQMALEKEQWEWQKAQAEASSSGGGGGGGYRRSSGDDSPTIKKSDSGVSSIAKAASSKVASGVASATASASNAISGRNDALNEAIAEGASKDKVANSISLALRNGKITQAEAADLRKTFTPRGYTY